MLNLICGKISKFFGVKPPSLVACWFPLTYSGIKTDNGYTMRKAYGFKLQSQKNVLKLGPHD
ncbi:hypothetical protein C6503_19150 [Candidatus Poribacteria bacterium]|nr:MAG: hypothetical protein C6503_19150 [Candidatus Poribacteria bacterium]